jgi:hypothetical protein
MSVLKAGRIDHIYNHKHCPFHSKNLTKYNNEHLQKVNRNSGKSEDKFKDEDFNFINPDTI